MLVFRKDEKRQMSPQNREKVKIVLISGRFIATISKITQEEMLTVSERIQHVENYHKKFWLAFCKQYQKQPDSVENSQNTYL